MNHRTHLRGLICLLTLFSSFAFSQSILITQPLDVTSTCPGSIIGIPFTLPYESFTTNTVFTVQLSDGGEFTDIPTGKSLMDGEKVSATMPMSLTPGVTYSVRITTKNPDYIGTTSLTKLLVKGKEVKPPIPIVDSLILTCMSEGTGSDDSHYAFVDFRLVPDATVRLYYNDQRDIFSEYAEFPYVTQQNGVEVKDKQRGYFQINKYGFSSPTYVYPVNERTFYLSQRIDGCESEPVATKVRIIWSPGGGPTPLNPIPGLSSYGKVTYCQGDQAYPLNVNGHKPPPENYQVTYAVGGPQSANPVTLIPPVPDTSTPGRTGYILNLVPIDPSKGCANPYMTFTFLTVTVNPTPTKPTATTGLIEYYQGQPSTPLHASTTDTTAMLVWYGTNATGGIGSATAPQPPTNQIGPLTYYVTQKVGTCESARLPIQVMVNPLLSIEDQSLAEAVDVYPVPATTNLTVRINGLPTTQTAFLEITDLIGHTTSRQVTRQATSSLSLDQHPAGTYILTIQVGDRKAARRIVKL